MADVLVGEERTKETHGEEKAIRRKPGLGWHPHKPRNSKIAGNQKQGRRKEGFFPRTFTRASANP